MLWNRPVFLVLHCRERATFSRYSPRKSVDRYTRRDENFVLVVWQDQTAGSRRDGFEKGVSDSLLDGQTADRETVLSASIHDIFAGAVVTRRRVRAAIMRQ